MNIRRGNVVSHTGAHEWGVGTVLEVTPFKATIQFSDGIIRKIASSHYTTLQLAAPAPKALATSKRQQKAQQPAI